MKLTRDRIPPLIICGLFLIVSIYSTRQALASGAPAGGSCLGYEPPDGDCDSTCEQLQAAAKQICEEFSRGSDTVYIYVPTGCTMSPEGCAQQAQGRCEPAAEYLPL